MKKEDSKKTCFFAVAALVVAADQVSKLLFLSFPLEYEVKAAGIRLLGFQLLRNTGAAFGMLKGNAFILAVVSAVFIAIVLAKLKEVKKAGLSLPMALICGGAAGNLVDRIFRGYVIDFVSIINIPYFNLADASISIGMLLAIMLLLKKEHKKTKKKGINLKENKNI
ncbi:MAG TPA: signal peptidase II [Candidatus Woesearchaeota archaeon]|nr:signal peptidase II [Candidatus Woesearchaeota archaeon]